MMSATQRKYERDTTYSAHAQDLAYLLAVAIEEGCTDIEVSTGYGHIKATVHRHADQEHTE